MKRIIVAGLMACLALSTAQAADVYVSRDTGSNKNPGTKEAPKKLLWKVMKKLNSGDKVFVAEGTYFGKSKSGVMPSMGIGGITLEGGWKKDFSARDPFKYLSIIAPPADRQGAGGEVFQFRSQKGDIGDITIDGFCIDRGPHNYYYAEGGLGPNKKIEGHVDNTCFGFRSLNRKKSGSDPTIEILGKKGNLTVRNCILINNPWWGISLKGGGSGMVIENNLILISQGRGVETLAWGGKPTTHIRNNTIMFNHTLKTTEGRAISSDPKKSNGKIVIERNVLACSDGGGITVKFPAPEGSLAVNDNLFFFNRRADYCMGGGTGVANAEEFEDELEIDNEDNVHEMPKLISKLSKHWFDRYSKRGLDMLAGNFNKEADLLGMRKALGLGDYVVAGHDKPFKTYKGLPKARDGYDMSRYPRPMKKGETIDWAKDVLPLIGADGTRGVQPFKK